MKTFSGREMKLIGRLKDQSRGTVLGVQDPCPLHSYCNPLPVFRVYKIDDATFEAEWNDYHKPGIKQIFSFAEVI
jgi:hypothetical protein